MSEFKTMTFVRKTRDKMYEETKNRTNAENRDYYRKKADWLNSSPENKASEKIRTKKNP